jgi:AcrR family transcriptional regulator
MIDPRDPSAPGAPRTSETSGERPDDGLTEKQRRVLEAAVDVFAERGYAAASTAEIARRAGVAEGTVFKTYKTKKDLLLGVVAPFFARRIAPIVLDDVRKLMQLPHASIEDFLRALYRNRLDFITSHERLVRIAFQEVPFHDEVRAIVKDTAMALIYPEAIALIRRLQAEGKVRAGEPSSILRIVGGTFLTYSFVRVLVAPEAAWDDGAEVELMVQVIGKGLRPE